MNGSLEPAESPDPEEWHRILDRFFWILADEATARLVSGRFALRELGPSP